MPEKKFLQCKDLPDNVLKVIYKVHVLVAVKTGANPPDQKATMS